METIFIPIASFLDYETKYTILDVIDKAKHPERLTFAVVLQFDEERGTDEWSLDELVSRYPIKIEKYHWTESRGGCWARHRAQLHYAGERYSLQIDSHIRMIKNWDEILIKNMNTLREKSPKPIISYLSPLYTREDELGIDYHFDNIHSLDRMEIPKIRSITSQYWPIYGGYENQRHTGFKNVNVPLLYGGFIFSDGQWVVDVEQDPLHYYTGEEFALAIRSFTKGYDTYLPDQIVSWHRAHPGPNKKHFNTFPEAFGNRRHGVAMERLRMLIEGGDLGKYGLGTERTLQQYEEFSGVDFKTQTVIEKNWLDYV
jgi:hypothetical protein